MKELEIDEELDDSLRQQEIRAIQEWKQKRTQRRWAAQPSKAPLESQESCVIS